MPADAVPVEFVLLGYPILDSLPLPDNEAGTDAGDQAGGIRGPVRKAEPRSRARRKCQTPSA
jgi:hypothetical protein